LSVAEFRYTAKRSVLADHIIDRQYMIEIGTTAGAGPASRRVDKTEVRARGGATETLYHKADREWSLTFEPVNGDRLNQLIEFLDSTESGEAFEMRLYGSESSFTTVKRSDEGYDPQSFMPVGSQRGDWWQISISVRAV
jgi:hypothetical protein